MKTPLTVGTSAAILAACQPSAPREQSEIGRYHFHEATAQSPAFVMDTKTGCMEEVVKLTDTENPNIVYWARKHTGASLTDKDGKALATPRQCPGSKTP